MKTFSWRLQRVLDVRGKQEDALRTELTALTEQIAAIRGRILMEKTMLRSRLTQLRNAEAAQRLTQQHNFMQDVAAVDKLIAAFEADLSRLNEQRNKKIEAMMQVRKLRKALERLKEQAWEAYRRDLGKLEQKNQDESTSIAIARALPETVQSIRFFETEVKRL